MKMFFIMPLRPAPHAVSYTHLSNVLFQYVCNEYMTKYDFAAHLDKARDVYRAKCNLMLLSLIHI